jgi:SNF2 family DNA or RNA helicase
VFLISLKAGGTGLNLTAADYVLHLDPWWNPAVEDQATDRAHRIGQTKPVVACKLIASDTVEERILALQEAKRALLAAAVGDADVLAQQISKEELLGLFG